MVQVLPQQPHSLEQQPTSQPSVQPSVQQRSSTSLMNRSQQKLSLAGKPQASSQSGTTPYTILVTLFEGIPINMDSAIPHDTYQFKGRYFLRNEPAPGAHADEENRLAKSKLYIQCRFNNEILTTDPVDYSTDPIWDTELAWQLNLRTLRYLRTQRAMLKLQCFRLDAHNQRELVGYLMLDLRQAQDFPAKEKWVPLVHLKTVGFRPEVRLAFGLGVEGSQLPPVLPTLAAGTTDIPHRPASSTAYPHVKVKPAAKVTLANTSTIRQTIDQQIVHPQMPRSITAQMTDAGYYQIGEGKTFYLFTITISYAGHLQSIVRSHANSDQPMKSGYYFYFNLFGSVIVTEPFFDLKQPTFTGERVLIRLRSSVDTLKQFFGEWSSIPVYLCQEDHVLGFTEIPVNSCFQGLARDRVVVEALYPMLDKAGAPPMRTNTSPAASVGVVLTLEEEVSGDAAFSRSTAVPASPQKPSKGNRAVSVIGHVSGTPAATNKSAVLKSHPSSTGSVVPQNWHQFRLAVDLRSLVQFKKAHSGVYCKYSYAPFTGPDSAFTASSSYIGSDARGGGGTITTYPSLHVYAQHENLLPHSFCAFEFLMDPQQFATYLESLPLLVEVWGKTGDAEGGEDVKIGAATVVMASLLNAPSETIAGTNSSSAVRKRVERVADIYADETIDKIGALKVVLVMEDFGERTEEDQQMMGLPMTMESVDVLPPPLPEVSAPSRMTERPQSAMPGPISTMLPSRPPSTKPKLGEPRPPPSRAVMSYSKSGKPVNVRQTLEYKAAMDLETWKQGEREKFEKKLKDTEAILMAQLAKEWKVKETERESVVQTRVAELKALESRALDMIRHLEDREKKFVEEEKLYERRHQEMEEEVERRKAEARDEARRMAEECDAQIQLEQRKLEEAEKETFRMVEEKKALEHKFKELQHEFHQYRNTNLRFSRVKKSEATEGVLRSEVDQLNADKKHLEEEIQTMEKSKKYYKQAWMKAMQDLNEYRTHAEEEARLRVEKEQRELDHMRLRYLEKEEQDLMMAGPPGTSKPPASEVPVNSEPSKPVDVSAIADAEKREEVTRLLKEKEVLLGTGVYNKNDKLLKLLDEKIGTLTN